MNPVEQAQQLARQLPGLQAAVNELTEQTAAALERLRKVHMMTGTASADHQAWMDHELRLSKLEALVALGVVGAPLNVVGQSEAVKLNRSEG